MADESTTTSETDDTTSTTTTETTQTETAETTEKAAETDWKAKSREWEKRAKDNNAAQRAMQQQLDQVAQLLGLKKGEELDPKALAEQLSASQSSERGSKVELAVFRSASKHGADPDALLDSLSFRDAVKDLDPSAADFASRVEAAIKDAVEGNPKLKAAAAAGRSGGDFSGGTGAGAPITQEQLSKMTPDQIAKAFDEGKLKHLM